MSKYQEQTFTDETGSQDIMSVDPEHVHTVIISGTSGQGGDDIDLEIMLDSPRDSVSERFKLDTDVISAAVPYIKKIDSPVQGIGVDIDGNNGTGIIVRVLSALQ